MSAAQPLDERIRALFEDMALEVPAPETDLFATGILNSLSFVELLTALEEAFGVRFELTDLEPDHFRTVEAIAGFISATRRADTREETRSA